MAAHDPPPTALGNDALCVTAAAPPLLPKYFILKSHFNFAYMRHIDGNDDTSPRLKFSGPNTEKKPDVQFEAEVSTSDPKLVHIKCCYNNKYLAAQGMSNHWIAATTTVPEEDQSKWSCTLFRPEYQNRDANTLFFRHVATGNYATMSLEADEHLYLFHAYSQSEYRHKSNLYTVIDWEKFLILPKRIVFKGGNEYLNAYYYDNLHFMSFTSSEMNETYTPHELVPGADGTVRVRNEYFDAFWRVSTDENRWILADARKDYTGPETFFRTVEIGDNTIALRSLVNNKFCRRLTAGGRNNCLSASRENIDTSSELVIGEPIVSRVIERVKFRIPDAMIYGKEEEGTKITHEHANYTEETSTKSSLFAHTYTRNSTWNYGASLKLKTSMSIKAGIPLLVDGEVKISGEITGKYQWGEAVKTEVEVGSKYTVILPKQTRLKVTMSATRGSCQVPFTYVQRDTLLNGDVVVTEMDGGFYIGTNSYNFLYETLQIPL